MDRDWGSAGVVLAVPGLVALGFAWLKPAGVRVLVQNGACLVGLVAIAGGALWRLTR
jgi:hypothetical protein